MIDAQQALAIVRSRRDGDPNAQAGVSAYRDQGFVVSIAGGNPYSNRPIYVDAATGETRTLDPHDYFDLKPDLVSVLRT